MLILLCNKWSNDYSYSSLYKLHKLSKRSKEIIINAVYYTANSQMIHITHVSMTSYIVLWDEKNNRSYSTYVKLITFAQFILYTILQHRKKKFSKHYLLFYFRNNNLICMWQHSQHTDNGWAQIFITGNIYHVLHFCLPRWSQWWLWILLPVL